MQLRPGREGDDHACMGDSVLPVVESRSHDAALFSHTGAEHLLQAVRPDELRIRSQEEEIVSLRLLHALIEKNAFVACCPK